MEIKVERTWKRKGYAGGNMFINDKWFCFTIEDEDRGMTSNMSMAELKRIKKYGITAIPTGRYEVIINFSNRFKQYMPLLLNVPNYEGVRIHVANSAKDVEGCIGIAMESSEDGFAGNSRAAYTKFMAELRKVEKKEKIWITIV